MKTQRITLTVNGEAHDLEVRTGSLLSDMLRDNLHLTGTKRGCETGVCGACSVQKDGELVKSCLSLAVQADGSNITTIEGLSKDGELHPIQEAFIAHGGLQCGYCTPGMIMTACAFLKDNPSPTRDEVRKGLSGNLCRCTGYVGIVDAIMASAENV